MAQPELDHETDEAEEQEISLAEQFIAMEKLDVKDVLWHHFEGRTILKLFKKNNGTMPNAVSNRMKIGHIVVEKAMTLKTIMDYDTLELLAAKIAKVFPGEKPNYYFQRPAKGSGKQPTGVMYDRYRNLKHKSSKMEKSSLPSAQEPPPVDQDGLTAKQTLDEHPDFEPLEECLRAWNNSRNLRKSDLSATKKKQTKKQTEDIARFTVAEYVGKWSSLKTEKGPTLIGLDFQAWYSDAMEFREDKFDNLIQQLKTLLPKSSKLITNINELETVISSADSSADEKFASKMYLLSLLMPPNTRWGRKKKPATISSQDSMILLVNTAENLDQRIRARAEYLKELKQPLQPILAIVGENLKNIEGIYCCINNIKWKMNDMLTAFDTLFKTFFALGTSFPRESEVIWAIIQSFMYELNTEDIPPKAYKIIPSLKTFVPPPIIQDQ